MKPLQLTMSAFGVFAKEAVVDFENAGKQGVFLISGNNGSGKTSIFDAVSFALYGKTSNPEHRTSKTIHSDFSPEKEKTHVCLKFSHQGHIYEVDRWGRLDKDKKMNMYSVTLYQITDGEKKIIAERQTAVDAKIISMLGMNQKQFSQTVMIAQGKFQEIVNAESKDRLKLFQDLFRTGIYQQFQERLKEISSDYNRRMERLQDTITGDLERIRFTAQYQPNAGSTASVQLNALTAQNRAEAQSLEQMTEQKNIQYRELETLLNQIKEGEILNADFQALQQKSKAMQKIIDRTDEMNQKKEQIHNAQNAQEVSKTEQLLLQLKRQLDEKNKKYQQLSQDADVQSGVLEQYRQELKQAEAKAQQLPALREQESQLAQAQPLFQEFHQKEKEYDHQKAQFLKKQNDYDQSVEMHKDLLKRFLSGQAGILAEQQLRENQPCPVCGSVHHPNPAEKNEHTPSQEQVQNAETLRNKKEQDFQKSSQVCVRLKAELDTLRQNPVLASMNEGQLVQSLASCRQQIHTLEDNLLNAQKQAQKQEKLYSGIMANLEQLAKDKTSLQKETDAQETASRNLLEKYDFHDEAAYHAAVLETSVIRKLEKEVNGCRAEYISLRDAVRELQAKTSGKQSVSLNTLRTERQQKESAYHQTEETLQMLASHLSANQQIETALQKNLQEADKIRIEWGLYADLYKTVSGQKGNSQAKLQLETYVQQYYFRRVVFYANQRLSLLTGDRFILRCSETAQNLRTQSGLGLEVLDNTTGQWRNVGTLSGGESFLTSLSLALGLSDAVQETSGGMELDAMFIDEGFGTLDDQSLHQAVELLGKLAGGNRLIGVISHVSVLKNRIDSQIQVIRTAEGSVIRQS